MVLASAVFDMTRRGRIRRTVARGSVTRPSMAQKATANIATSAPDWMQEFMNKVPMTAAGHATLEDELKQRIRIERPRLIQRIQDAIADDSNLVENATYQSAKADQEFNEARIADLEDKLARAEVVDVSKLSGDTVKFGATVTLIDEDSDEKKVWQLVGEPEADVSKGKISITSPIARALIGKSRGDTVEVDAPGGTKSYEVRKVEWTRIAPK